ncbi:hypothetical protein Hanom_Chr01g00004121 [Helianthus anomalus]
MRIDLGDISGDRNIEPFNSVIDVEELPNARSEETQQKNRRRTIMSYEQKG